jgi:hypothetical protein
MFHQAIMKRLHEAAILSLAMASLMALSGVAAHGQGLATVKNLTVTPRDVSTSSTQGYNLVATGLDTVGIGKTVYLEPEPTEGSESLIKGYNWKVTQEPSVGAAALDIISNGLFKFRPTKAGAYTITLTPINQSSQATTATTISIWAAEYLGAEGGWSCATCHDGFYLEDKLTPWKGTGHANILTEFLNGERSASYRTSCLPCHTTGAYANTSGDGNFLDVAASTGFDLNQIPTWVADAYNNGNGHWDDLPASLQHMANIQCESCHGPGKTHNGNLSRISVPSYDGEMCAYCHDAPTHHMRPYQWRNSAHSQSNNETSASCLPCHTAEGFVEIRVRGNSSVPADVTTRSPISCVACHDPHDDTNPHQLRTVAPVTLPNGYVFDFGIGSICANCHNSRIADPNVTNDLATGSYRGAHNGPQSDIFLGTTAYTWGLDYPAGIGPHYVAVADGCVECHMAPAPEGVANPTPIGDHTFRIHDEESGESTVAEACGECHEGLTTTDRVLAVPRDFDGNGASQGVQTEVRGILDRLQTELLNRLPGTSLSASTGTISISSANWKKLTLDQRAALYNFNLMVKDGSLGVHNTKYAIAVLQRSYLRLTSRRYNDAFTQAFLVDNDPWVPASGVGRGGWQFYN